MMMIATISCNTDLFNSNTDHILRFMHVDLPDLA